MIPPSKIFSKCHDLPLTDLRAVPCMSKTARSKEKVGSEMESLRKPGEKSSTSRRTAAKIVETSRFIEPDPNSSERHRSKE
ncbi:unnamed protein product [Caenorhabditis angaria]|uniref:Uncharacterized protein n=1 Tax=Caenorhabditis angaria TaxID=860376 RepID=A0A9P1MVY6_9PELO|nr:unnamed protein product [Caenorhabditis angaria]